MNKLYTKIARLGMVSLLLFLLSALTLLGQTPTTFNYQAVLRDASGHILESSNVSIQLVIHQGTATGTTAYSEVHNTTTTEFGLVNLEIGSITPATFATIDWSAGPYFVEVIVNGTSMGASELLTVPYALYAVNGVPGLQGIQGPQGVPGPEGPPGTLAPNSVNSSHVVDGSLTAADLAAGSVGASEIVDGSVGAADIATDGVGAAEIAANSVGTSELDPAAFVGWDQNAADDFSGNYGDLTGRPDLSDMVSIANPQNGDIAYYSSGNWLRLPAGADGEVLSLNSGLPDWRNYGSRDIQAYFQFVTFRTGYASAIAFGFIAPDGSISSGSGNFTCVWNPTYNRYEITITSHSYFWTGFTTVVTLAQQLSTEGAIAKVGSVGGMLLIHIER